MNTHCGVRAKCTDSRKYPAYVRRRYRCVKCSHRWTTVELLVPDNVSPEHFATKLKPLSNQTTKEIKDLATQIIITLT